MTSAVISFRASGDFLELLQSQVLSGESVNQTAQRLLRGCLNVPVAAAVNSVNTSIAPGFDLILERLDRVESRLSHLESSESVATPIAIAAAVESPNKQLTIFDALEEVEISLKSSGLLGLSIEEEQNQLFREDLEKLQADYDSLLASSSQIISKLRSEVSDLRSLLETERCDRDELEGELQKAKDHSENSLYLRAQYHADLIALENKYKKVEAELQAVRSDVIFPDSADLLNALKSRRKKQHKACAVTLADIDTIFNLLSP